jgi:hypothetical protein
LSRRLSVPAADDLFRPTVVPTAQPSGPESERETLDEQDGTRAPSGRVRHDQKMTVYVTSDELLDIEHARLALRRAGHTVDRGRLVREAVAIALADLDVNGEDSLIVQRLTQA